MNLIDCVMVLALAARIHKTSKGVRATAHRLLAMCDVAARPYVSMVAVSPSPLRVIWTILDNIEVEENVSVNSA